MIAFCRELLPASTLRRIFTVEFNYCILKKYYCGFAKVTIRVQLTIKIITLLIHLLTKSSSSNKSCIKIAQPAKSSILWSKMFF